MVKTALLRAEESLEMEKLEASLVMMIHDEMVWEVRESDMAAAAEVVKKSLENTREVLGMDGKSRRLEMKVKICSGDDLGSLALLEKSS